MDELLTITPVAAYRTGTIGQSISRVALNIDFPRP